MSEFQSKLETLLPAEELLFDATPGFGRYKPFLEQAIAHPAKMNTRLTEFLIKSLTLKGDLILDPMSGSGQTGVVAALLGRNAVCVELEEKFYKWQVQSKAKIDSSQTLSAKGKMFCILGDARKLSEILPHADAIVTSPPYSGSVTGNLPETERRAERMIAAGYDPKTVLGGHARNAQIEWRYAKRKDKVNIGNLAHGEIDAVITSPPYAIDPKNVCHTKEGKTLEDYDKKRGFKPTAHQRIAYSTNPENIGHLPLETVDAVITSPPYGDAAAENRKGGILNHPENCKCNFCRKNKGNRGEIQGYRSVDAVITSPPYAQVCSEKHGGKDPNPAKAGGSAIISEGYSSAQGNIGNLKMGEVDTVITSPPYEEAQQGSGIAKRGYQGNKHSPIDLVGKRSYMPDKFENNQNISLLKKETYLEAMLKVYEEMWKVLKEGGLVVIVVKPFIRNKTVVDLPYQTWLLMQKCGFKLTKLFKLRLTQQSFWRILYQKKHPEVDVIAHEYVLVAQKPFSFSS